MNIDPDFRGVRKSVPCSDNDVVGKLGAYRDQLRSAEIQFPGTAREEEYVLMRGKRRAVEFLQERCDSLDRDQVNYTDRATMVEGDQRVGGNLHTEVMRRGRGGGEG